MGSIPTILFVYGTLRRGGRNHRLVADQTFLGEAVTAPRHRVVDLGPYPGLVRDAANGLSVHGELYAVSECCLEELDDFEGVPELFVREWIEVEGHGEVWAYYWAGPVPGGAPTGDHWPLA
jgi:gamma-glutamylaminecyclotransferase